MDRDWKVEVQVVLGIALGVPAVLFFIGFLLRGNPAPPAMQDDYTINVRPALEIAKDTLTNTGLEVPSDWPPFASEIRGGNKAGYPGSPKLFYVRTGRLLVDPADYRTVSERLADSWHSAGYPIDLSESCMQEDLSFDCGLLRDTHVPRGILYGRMSHEWSISVELSLQGGRYFVEITAWAVSN